MRTFFRLIVLILVMALTRAATFGITTWYYRIRVLEDATAQLYCSIAAAVAALLIGIFLVPSKKKKKQPVKVEEKPKKEEKKIETAKVIQEPMGITVDEIPQQPDLQEMPEYEEPDIDLFHTSMALPVISEEEEAAENAAEPELQNPGIEDISEFIQEEEKPFVDDTTRVISTASIKEYLDHVEKGEKVTETSVSNAAAPKFQTVVSPFGPRKTQSEEEEEKYEEIVPEEEPYTEELVHEENFSEEPVYEEPVQEEPAEQENVIEQTQDAIDWSAGDDQIKEEIPEYQPQLQPQKEADEVPDVTLSRTREQFITRSNMSYIDETGKPQFHVTEEIKKVDISDEELGIGKDFEGFDVKAERAERINHILNTIIAVLAIRLALIVIYYFYTRFFG